MSTWCDCWREDKLICPYCYQELEFEDYYRLVRDEGDIDKITCPCCNKEFYAKADKTYKFTSYRIDKEGERIEYWDGDEDEEEEYE